MENSYPRRRRITGVPRSLLKSVSQILPPMPAFSSAQGSPSLSCSEGCVNLDFLISPSAPGESSISARNLSADGSLLGGLSPSVSRSPPDVASNGEFYSTLGCTSGDRAPPKIVPTLSCASGDRAPSKNVSFTPSVADRTGVSFAESVRRGPQHSTVVKMLHRLDANKFLCRLKKSSPSWCMRCGDRDHPAAECRNPRLCFACKQTGHIAKQCPKLRNPNLCSYPPNCSPPSRLLSPLCPPLMSTRFHKLNPTATSQRREAERAHSFFIHTDANTSLAEISCAISRLNPPGRVQIRPIGFHWYQLIGPLPWKKQILEQKIFWLGSKPLEPVEWIMDLDPKAPTSKFWVRVVGAPYEWRTLEGMKEIVYFGQVVNADPNTK